MDSIVWWPTLSLVAVAAVIDLRCRRTPNWLVLPFRVAGTAPGVGRNGLAGFEKSQAGIAVAAVALGEVCAVRGIGMGDFSFLASYQVLKK
jgi:prepilin peptidase CpaA